MVRDEYNHSRPVSALIRDWLLYNKAGGGGGILKTVTGNPISISDALAAPIQSLSVSLSPIQEGSGDPSPENERPITGRDSVTVERTGKNLWDEEWEVGGIDNDGNKVSRANQIRSKNFINITPETNYYIAIDGTGFTLYPCFYDRNGGFITRGTYLSASGVRKSPVDAYKMMFYIWKSAWTDYENHPDISINYPSTDTEYEPYDGQSVTIQLGQTVYGGTVDVVSGKLTVDRAMVDMGTLTWTYNSSSQQMLSSYITNANLQKTGRPNALCSVYKVVDSNGLASAESGSFTMWNGKACVKDLAYTDADSFTTDVTGQQLVYELAEYLTVQLAGQSMTTLKGTNNVWSDGDDISMIYKAASS